MGCRELVPSPGLHRVVMAVSKMDAADHREAAGIANRRWAKMDIGISSIGSVDETADAFIVYAFAYGRQAA